MQRFFSFCKMTKTKLKPVLPSLREKKRYLVFEIISREKITNFEPVSACILDATWKLLGILGAARAGIVCFKNKWNPRLQRGIIKTSHKYVDAIKSSLMLINKIENKEVILRSLGVSGILRKAESNYLN